MRAFLATVILASLLVAGTSVVAAPETGTRFDRTPKAVRPGQIEGDNAGRVVMNQYARCNAEIKREKAMAALALPYLSEEQSKAVGKLARGIADCLGPNSVTLSFQAPAMVAGMAEEFVLTDFKNADVSSISAISEEQMFASSFKPRNQGEDFAQCVVRADPNAARAILSTKVASDDEAMAVKKLVPQLGPCLVSGQKIEINGGTVRAIASVGLYRILSGLAAETVKK
jgi:hypothetical protein